MTDTQLRQNVIDELEFEPSVHCASIGVAVEDGVVTLSGHVRSYAEKVAAERATRRVRGVRAIAQDIHVRYPDEKKTADDEIAKRTLSIIKWDAMTPADAIKVVVQNGWITLSGEVDWQYQRKAAEDAVRKLSGVIGVFNNITLKRAVQVADIKRKIEQALARRAKVDADAIRIDVHDGNRVALEGTVESWDERDAVQDAAWSVPGVQSVDDRLTIVR
jgi:osmotically-inducible protein OsmY